MRLPFLQVTQEAWDYARSLSALANVDLGRAFMAVCDVWRWGLSLGPEDQPPSGICDSPRAPRLLCAAIGWAGDADELASMLDDLGLVEKLPGGGLRVKGTDRYKRTWEKNKRRRPSVPETGSMVPVTGANPAPSAPVPARQTQTQTQTQTQKEKPPAGATEAATAPVGYLRDSLEAAWLKARGAKYAWKHADDVAAGALLDLAGGSLTEILRRAAIGFDARFPRARHVPDLVRNWDAYGSAEATGPPAGRGRATNADKDWSRVAPSSTGEVQFD